MNEHEAVRFLDEQIIARWPDDGRPAPTEIQMLDWLRHLMDMDYDLALAAALHLGGSHVFPRRPVAGELRKSYLAVCEGPEVGWEVFWRLAAMTYPEPWRPDGLAEDAMLEPAVFTARRKELLAMPWGRMAWDVARNLGLDDLIRDNESTAQARFRDAFEKARAAKRSRMLQLEATGGEGLQPATNVAHKLAAATARAQLRAVN